MIDNDKEITQTLKNHLEAEDCVTCESFGKCDEFLLTENTLNLINHQQTEIERLKRVIDKIKDLVKGLRIGFDNEVEYVFDETLEKINEITDECYEEVKE